MAKEAKSPSNWSDIEYIRCDLDKQLKADLQEWLKKKHDWFAYIETEVSNGLRFGCHEDKFNQCVEARLTLLSNSVGVSTLVLQGRGPDLMAAIQSLFFKHIIVLEKDWTSLDRIPQSRFSDWG